MKRKYRCDVCHERKLVSNWDNLKDIKLVGHYRLFCTNCGFVVESKSHEGCLHDYIVHSSGLKNV